MVSGPAAVLRSDGGVQSGLQQQQQQQQSFALLPRWRVRARRRCHHTASKPIAAIAAITRSTTAQYGPVGTITNIVTSANIVANRRTVRRGQTQRFKLGGSMARSALPAVCCLVTRHDETNVSKAIRLKRAEAHPKR